ncbi:ORF_071R [Scale drop disease virus]|uniref:ORF_071R n=1 Tax=Scale drop disease virus TaxID=1697349 RepID=A0A0K1L686_9VIRU|nr:ORF_071R [Scale drop disease virus]AKU37486.1 ORF_071R [Scale drop disease virus]
MTANEKQTRLSTTAVKEQLKSGAQLHAPDIKFSGHAVTVALDYMKTNYCINIGKDINAALEYSKSKTVTDKLLKLIKITDWSTYTIPEYYIKTCTVLRLLKSVIPSVRIQQQVKVILQHHLCMFLFLLGYASAEHAVAKGHNVVKPEDVDFVLKNRQIHPHSIVTPPVPRKIKTEIVDDYPELREAIEAALA